MVVVLIIILFSLLVILHEWGHFMAARRGGVDVEEFGIGFPPRAWGKKVGKTLYSINWLPLGGFVRLKGEDTGAAGPHTFNGARFRVKVAVLLAGVGMNLLTAIVVLYGLCITGLPAIGAQFEPRFLQSTYAQAPILLVTQVVAGSPAAEAGLVRGDYVLEAGGKKITQDTQLRSFTKTHAGETVSLKVRTDGREHIITPKLKPASSGSSGFLGVASQQVYKVRYDPLRALVAAVYVTGALTVATIVGVVQLLLNIPVLLMGLFQTAVPQAAEAASGPVGIIFILQSISSLGLSYIFLFIANIAVALAAFNVLPLPALDGGRLAVIAAQKLAKRRLQAETEAKIHAIGFMALMGLVALITVYDVRKFFFHV
jgi:regulator of sigma E protease